VSADVEINVSSCWKYFRSHKRAIHGKVYIRYDCQHFSVVVANCRVCEQGPLLPLHGASLENDLQIWILA
jgi:hypothetical protein